MDEKRKRLAEEIRQTAEELVTNLSSGSPWTDVFVSLESMSCLRAAVYYLARADGAVVFLDQRGTNNV
jgi:hypothetical protein